MIDPVLEALSTLRTARDRRHWSSLTRHRAPHKPFLLLSIIDLVARGGLTRPFVEPSFELAETFNGYWPLVMPPARRGLPSYPFYHLRSEPFWQLVPNPGHTDAPGRTFGSMARIREVYAGAGIEDALFAAFADPVRRELARRVLVETYFHESVRQSVYDQAVVHLLGYAYASELTAGVRESPGTAFEAEDEVASRVRGQGFRRAIVQIYDHRCALCGIRMLTPDGHTVVEAAHIKPWSVSFDDRPTNGLCLCRLCHWSYDEGLMAVGRNYQVLVSGSVRKDRNYPGHVLSLAEREMIRPAKPVHCPDQDNLGWHRKKVFRR